MSTPMAPHKAKTNVGRVCRFGSWNMSPCTFFIEIHEKGSQSIYKMNSRHLEELELLE
jgi:hypothetical protein